jgi:hypothetical protein
MGFIRGRRSRFFRGHQFPGRTVHASLADFPFPFVALRFAAVELTEGNTLKNIVGNLPPGPIPYVLKKVQGSPVIACGALSEVF